ncbi:MAG: hypothetical protein QME79_14935 [Bacillota bacterium]|nr:hypothetical protein [Bacillota bacterium]
MVSVVFERRGGGFQAFVSVEPILSSSADPELLLRKAEAVYGRYVEEMQEKINDIELHRKTHTLLPARKVWQVGDSVFRLVAELAELSLEMADVYGHLCRDLGAKRKWLEKAIILRRYVPDLNLIPESMPWGRVEKGTRKAAEKLAQGLIPGQTPRARA